jgi:hypothetical protein
VVVVIVIICSDEKKKSKQKTISCPGNPEFDPFEFEVDQVAQRYQTQK